MQYFFTIKAFVFVMMLGLPFNAFAQSLVDLWNKVKENNLELRESEALKAAAASEHAAAIGSFLPHLGAQIAWEKVETVTPQAEDTIMNYGLRLDQSLLDLQAVRRSRLLDVDAKIAEVQLESKTQELIYQLILLYWRQIYLSDVITRLDASLNGEILTLESQVQRAIAQGLRDQAALSTFLLQTSTLRLRLLRLKSEEWSNREKLSVLLGEEIKSLDIDGQRSTPSLDLLNENQTNPLETLQLLLVERQSARASAAYASLWPSLSLFANYDQTHRQRQGEAHIAIDKRLVYGLLLSFNLFAGASDLNQIRAENHRSHASQHRFRSFQLRQRMSDKGMQDRLKASYQSIQESQRLWQIAHSLKTRAERQQEAGLGSFDIMIGPVIQELELALLYHEAQFDYVQTLAQELLRRGLLDTRVLSAFDQGAHL